MGGMRPQMSAPVLTGHELEGAQLAGEWALPRVAAVVHHQVRARLKPLIAYFAGVGTHIGMGPHVLLEICICVKP